MKTVTLNNGVLMPQLGLGTFLSKDGTECYDAVTYALELGYRHIDTAQMYHNEASVGKAIKDSGINRSEIFITTKQMGHTNLDQMKAQFEASLKALDTDYVDLYLIHWPNHDDVINAETWAYFESLYTSKKARAIGISNFLKHHIHALSKTWTIKPQIDQVEMHPGLSQAPLKKFLDHEGIQLESYGPLMRGGVFEGRYAEALSLIAKKHNKSVAQIVIAWGLQRGIVMIPKSVTPSRIKDNYEAQFITLSDDEMTIINDLNRGTRVYTDPDNAPWGRYSD